MTRNVKHIKPGYNLTEVGIIPIDWKVDTLRNNLKSSPRYWVWAAAVDYSFHLPKYLRITDISDDWHYLPEKMVSVNHPFAKNYYLTDWDIVVARTWASVWKSYLYNKSDGALVFAGFLICLKADEEKLVPQYLKNYLQTPTYWNWVKVTSMRSGQPWINGNEYASLNIPLPSKPEQTAIAKVLSDSDALISSLDKLIEKKKAIKLGAMQELLTGKKRFLGFSGKWESTILGKICEIKKGQLITSGLKQIWNVPVIAWWKTPAYYHSESNRQGKTITISASWANAGYISFYTIPIFASDCSTISESKDYSIEFIYYYLLLNQNNIYHMQTWWAQPHIHAKDLNPIQIRIPKLNEQMRIAQVLSDMDSEIFELEMKRDKYQHIKQGMMSELLTGNIRLLWVK